ncbi:PTS sugar transporter subunit IIA [Pectobacterium zantedeschiae]|uniref:PTS fructose transporter subunit IIA n=1 Tax=Pectobacterium zantedeschiae TaxID=2034769 RepID=A0A9X8P3L9_9GAMM|nr:PTS fructose transporter subunit IIA [Pectobacterium zantedeschiae]RYC39069.1 PTS fructose transporter subunit IIA [Pectobacterium zantedeschiae]RYC39899.1 PTS fructose transporter subunit IIA [Pectobacterium zantedeschiae]
MREIYIASHGRYAEGIVSALNLLIGEDHAIQPICAYCGDIGSTAELAECFSSIAQESARRGNELVIFTDMQGGSVNNTAVQLMVKYPHMHVISGVNLIMLMAFCLSENSDTAVRVREAITMAVEGMQYMNTIPELQAAREANFTPGQDSSDDFFTTEPAQ